MAMNFTDIVILTNVVLMGITSYFLKQTMDRVKSNEDVGTSNQKEIALVRQENSIKHEYVSKEFGELRESIKVLNGTIKELNSNMLKKNEDN